VDGHSLQGLQHFSLGSRRVIGRHVGVAQMVGVILPRVALGGREARHRRPFGILNLLQPEVNVGRSWEHKTRSRPAR
jgi:hypothetical protein